MDRLAIMAPLPPPPLLPTAASVSATTGAPDTPHLCREGAAGAYPLQRLMHVSKSATTGLLMLYATGAPNTPHLNAGKHSVDGLCSCLEHLSNYFPSANRCEGRRGRCTRPTLLPGHALKGQQRGQRRLHRHQPSLPTNVRASHPFGQRSTTKRPPIEPNKPHPHLAMRSNASSVGRDASTATSRPPPTLARRPLGVRAPGLGGGPPGEGVGEGAEGTAWPTPRPRASTEVPASSPSSSVRWRR